MASASDIRSRILSLLGRDELPKYGDFVSLCDGAVSVLVTEDSSYRSPDSSGAPGGLLDFTGEEFAGVDVLVVPDLHARGYFLLDVLDFRIRGGNTVLERLLDGSLIVCCVGDIPHAESRAKDRWAEAYRDFCSYFYDGGDSSVFSESPAMVGEMLEDLSLWQMIFLLKRQFPANFHVLRGNHENVKNTTYEPGENFDFGNRGFRKFCEEGAMCSEFISLRYDDLFLHRISGFEQMLPVCAVFRNCVVSHAEPSRVFTREEIVDGLSSDEVVFGLTWTANDAAPSGTVERTMRNLYRRGGLSVFSKAGKNSLWIGGHRPVSDRYALRQDGKYVQIHNPEREFVSLVKPDERFDPDADIFDVRPK